MPTLAETLKKNNQQGTLVRGQAGSLVDSGTEEIQSLSNKAGLASPPLTPLGAGSIGANPDQQKMMGTPAQKNAALSIAQPGQGNLSTALRQEQSRSQLTGQEQQAVQKSADMQALGGLGDRVVSLIETQRQKLAAAAPQAVAVQSQSSFGGKDLTPIANKLAALRANPSDMQLQLEVNEYLGRDVSSTLSPEEINQLYQSAQEAIGAGGAAVVDDSIAVSNLLEDPAFGYDINSLSELLGVPADQLAGMNVGQLRNEIARASDEEFSQSEQALQQAGSGLAGQAERELARKQGRDLSATGIRASEADVQQLEEQIANADQVTFGGKRYNVDELLKDDTISGIISDYMQSSPDDPFRKQLEESEPELLDFIKKNEAVLADAAKQLSGAATGFRTIQDTNTRNLTLDNQLTDDVAKALIPQYKKLSAEVIDPNSIPVIAAGQNADPQYAQSVNTLVTSDPELGQELGQLSLAEVKALGLDSSTGTWKKVQNQRNQWKVYNDAMDTEELANNYFQNKISPDYSQNTVKNAQVLNILGYGSYGDLNVFDANHDGKVDSTEQIKQSLTGGAKPSLKSGINGQLNVANPTRFQPPIPPRDGIKKELYDKVSPAMMEAGGLNSQVLERSFPPLVGSTDKAGPKKQTELLMELSRAPGVNPETQKAIQSKINQAQEELARSFVVNTGKDWGNSGNAGYTTSRTIGYLAKVLEQSKNNPLYNDTFRGKLMDEINTQIRIRASSGVANGGLGSFKSAQDLINREKNWDYGDKIEL